MYLLPATDKTMSDQVYILILMFLYKNHQSSGKITVDDTDDLGSIPGGVNFLKFRISIPMTFSHVQGYIQTHLN